jgi:H+/Cl- antiporter ClcA
LPAFAPKPDGSRLTAAQQRLEPSGEARSLPYQWNLLAWAALVGLLTGVAVVLFHELLGFINNFLFGPLVDFLLVVGRSTPVPPPPPSLPDLPATTGGFLPPPPAPPEPPTIALPSAPDWLKLWPVVVIPTLGGLAVGLLRRFGGEIGPGLPSLMAMADGSLPGRPRLPFQRLLAASLSLASGASLGPEGPSVESGGNIGLWVAMRAGVSPQAQKALVAAGVAAGLAAGFKAPIAGVFFALEGSFSSVPGRPSLRAALVAAVASALITQLALGDTPILRLPAYEVRSIWELPFYLGLGLVSSLMSWVLVSLLAAGRNPRLQSWLGQLPPGLATAMGGLAVGGMALVFPQVLGVGYDTVEALLGRDGGIPLVALFSLLGMKLLASATSNAAGFVGGGFAPSLFLGAVLGNAYGQLLGDSGLHLPVAEPPAYAMVGMAAVLAGSARAPLTALLLLFELTRDIRIVLPLMAAAGLSAALVERWRGLRDPDLLGPDPVEAERRERLASLSIEEAFEPLAPLVLPSQLPAVEALEQLVASHGHSLIVADSGSAIGLVTLADLQRALSAAVGRPAVVRLDECLRTDLVWLPLGARLDQLEDQLMPNGLRQIPVFEVAWGVAGNLPQGLPSEGLPLNRLRGMASRDGMARALARQLQRQEFASLLNGAETKASATGST